MDELERQAALLRDRATAPPLDRVRARAGALRRRRHLVLVAAAVLVVGGLTTALVARDRDDRSRVDTVDEGTLPTTFAPTVTTGSPVTTSGAAASLALPMAGFAIEADGGVQLYGSDGVQVGSLPGYSLDERWQPSSGLLLVAPDGSLRAFGFPNAVGPDGGLVRVERAPIETVDSWPAIPLPPADEDVRTVVGHWRWTLTNPTRTVRLAQWSGECEVPAALLLDADNLPRSPFGGAWHQAPVSFAIGWLDDGRALVLVAEDPACGTAGEPGLWAVPLEGEPQRLLDATAAQSWGPPQSDPVLTARRWPDAVAATLTLTPDAVGPVTLGTDVDSAITALTAILGRPTVDGRSSTVETGFPTELCGSQIRYVAWGGLSLGFNDSAVGSQAGLVSWGLATRQPNLRTPDGIGIGQSVGDLRRANPGIVERADDFVEGATFVTATDAPNILYEAVGTGDDATIVSIRGGRTDCIGD